MEVAEMKMLRFAMGVTIKDKIRNKYIRGTVKVEQLRPIFTMSVKKSILCLFY